MKTQFKLATVSALVIGAFCAPTANAAEFAMNGYMRAGMLMTSDGTRGNDVGLMTNLGKFRLGNEQNTKIELLPKITSYTTDGVIARARANLTHETKCTADWNCVDGDGHELQVREGYAEIENLPFAPGAVWWGGKRYSSSNSSSHMYDWEYIQYNGTGGGVDKLDLGFAKLDVGFYAFTPSGENQAAPADPTQQGYPDDYSANIWLKKVGGSRLDLQVIAHTMQRNSWRGVGTAEDGFGATAVYNFEGFYGLGGGYSKATFQYGQGLASGDSLGKNGWGWANLKDTKSYRLALDGMYSVAGLDIATFAFYQSDTNYRNWTGKDTGWDRKLYAIGVRPYHQITKNFAFQYELGYEYYDESAGEWAGRTNMKGGLTKATIAPTLTFGEGFWARPALRAFVTYAKWDKGVSGRMDAGYTVDNNTSTLNFGLQAETWF